MSLSHKYGPNLQVIGVTGGVGGGKSTVLQLMTSRGVMPIKADDIAHEVVLPGTLAHRRIVDHFGDTILTPEGTVDRQRLADIVFADEGELADLNRIVHPPVIEHLRDCFNEIGASGDRVVVAVEIPLLVEAGMVGMVDHVVLVTASPEVRLARMVAQGWSEGKVRAVMRAQAADAEKAKHADVIIDNGGDLGQLQEKVDQVLQGIADEANS